LSIFVSANRHVPPAQPQLSQFMLERLPMHSQNRGRAGYVAAGFVQASRDIAPLELAAVIAKI